MTGNPNPASLPATRTLPAVPAHRQQALPPPPYGLRPAVPKGVAPTPLHELPTYVEHRRTQTLAPVELNYFETHMACQAVPLRFNGLVLTTMVRGKKVMHLEHADPFAYLPGESVLARPHELMVIDFPEAHPQQPTQCLAIVLDDHMVRRTLDYLNDTAPKVQEDEYWHMDATAPFHIHNSQGLAQSIDRLIQLAHDPMAPAQCALTHNAAQELVLRLMQTQAQSLVLGQYRTLATRHRFAAVVERIQRDLHLPIKMEQLADLACMSKATFFRSFKREFGITPVHYIQQERLRRARRLLDDTQLTVADIALRCGFLNLGHFYQTFTRAFGKPPRRLQRGAAH